MLHYPLGWPYSSWGTRRFVYPFTAESVDGAFLACPFRSVASQTPSISWSWFLPLFFFLPILAIFPFRLVSRPWPQKPDRTRWWGAAVVTSIFSVYSLQSRLLRPTSQLQFAVASFSYRSSNKLPPASAGPRFPVVGSIAVGWLTRFHAVPQRHVVVSHMIVYSQNSNGSRNSSMLKAQPNR